MSPEFEMSSTTDTRAVIVALDFASERPVLEFIERIDPASCRLKVGKELFTACGPQLVKRLVGAGFDVFLDLKFHDIPNTVARACAAAADLGVWMLNVHALGGRAMLEAAARAIQGGGAPRLIAVTLLTSSGQRELDELGIAGDPPAVVRRLAQLAQASGLDGVVCSAREAAMLRRERGEDFPLVTPGIRPAGSQADDQQRICTPREAIENGSDYLVIGRPITQADDPHGVLLTINASIR